MHLPLHQAMVWLRHRTPACAKKVALYIPAAAAAGTCFSMMGIDIFFVLDTWSD